MISFLPLFAVALAQETPEFETKNLLQGSLEETRSLIQNVDNSMMQNYNFSDMLRKGLEAWNRLQQELTDMWEKISTQSMELFKMPKLTGNWQNQIKQMWEFVSEDLAKKVENAQKLVTEDIATFLKKWYCRVINVLQQIYGPGYTWVPQMFGENFWVCGRDE